MCMCSIIAEKLSELAHSFLTAFDFQIVLNCSQNIRTLFTEPLINRLQFLLGFRRSAFVKNHFGATLADPCSLRVGCGLIGFRRNRKWHMQRHRGQFVPVSTVWIGQALPLSGHGGSGGWEWSMGSSGWEWSMSRPIGIERDL